MIVKKTSVFPASRDVVFHRLQRLATLQFIAYPYATFEPVGKDQGTWEVGSTSYYRFKLFGFIPFGIHTIHIVEFSPDGISSEESNNHVQTWNHDITLEELPDGRTRYTDRVVIKARWKTVFVWLWANAFYHHRQKRWIRLLSSD